MKKILASALISCLAGSVCAAQPPVQVELNFSDARIDAVASAVGAMIGKNVVVDPKVKGNMTLVSDTPVTPENALAQLQAALRMHGYAMVDSGQLFKVVPEADAKIHAAQVNAPATGGEVQTRVFRLQHENAAQVLNVVKPLVSPNNVVNVSPSGNALVVTDYADNIARIARLVASLDQPAVKDVEIIPLRHAVASELAPLLQHLVNDEAQPRTGGGRNSGASEQPLLSTLIADNRSNALIVRAANAARLVQIQSLAARLDQPAMQGADAAGNIHVVYLRHADAVAMAETLRAAMQTLEQSAPMTAVAASPTGTTATTVRNGGNTGNSVAAMQSQSANGGGLDGTASIALGQTRMPSTGGMVQADPNNNALIITAPAPLFRQLRAVIDRLDTRRAQVLVEGMIVEVSDSRLAEFGVQWQAAIGKQGSTMGGIGTNYSNAGGNILNIAAGLASGDRTLMANALSSLGGGLNLAIAPKALGQYYLGALANFLQQDGGANVLSKPNLLTLDNQEARIIIGSNVPFVTGSYATTGSTSTVNPFTTVERKDVGLMLRIRPTINENGTVRLTVSQEVSSIDQSTLNNVNGPSTSKRSVESTVLVDDGSIVMLGGLMQDSYSNSVDKVPVLGDVPVVGNLFRSENRTRSKTNLMIFLRPRVLRDAKASEDLALDRYASIRGMQQQMQPPASAVLGNIADAPVVPVLSSMSLPVQPPQPAETFPLAPVDVSQPQ